MPLCQHPHRRRSGLTTIVLGFTQAETRGWIDPLVLILIGTGGLLLAGFVAVQSRAPQPLLPLRIVTDRTRAGAFVSVAFSQVALFGFFLFITFYMQTILGTRPSWPGSRFSH